MTRALLVLTENVLNPDGSRASTKVTLLNGLVRSLVKLAREAPPTSRFILPTPSLRPAAPCLMFRITRASHRLPRPDLDAQQPLACDNYRERQVSASDGSG